MKKKMTIIITEQDLKEIEDHLHKEEKTMIVVLNTTSKHAHFSLVIILVVILPLKKFEMKKMEKKMKKNIRILIESITITTIIIIRRIQKEEYYLE